MKALFETHQLDISFALELLSLSYTLLLQFPSSGDVRVEMGVSYGVLEMNLKADRVTVVLGDGILKQRTSLEFNNFFWPFGISSTKETNRKSDTEIEVGRRFSFLNFM